MKASAWMKKSMENGNAIRVYICNFYGFNDNQVAKLVEAGCENIDGEWSFVAKTADEMANYCKNLRGFDAGGWSLAA